MLYVDSYKVSKGAKIRNRYNQVRHLTQDTNGKVTNSQLDTANESQEVNPWDASISFKQVAFIYLFISSSPSPCCIWFISYHYPYLINKSFYNV